jgi:hypothetical protein
MKRIGYIATLLLGAAGVSIVSAAPKTPVSSGPFVPEIAYRYTTNKSAEIRLSNAAGTVAVLAYRGPSGTIGDVDASPPNRRLIAWVDHGAPSSVRAVAWAPNTSGGVTFSAPVTLYTGQRVFGDQIDFSPDGNSIAFAVLESVTGRYSLLVRDLVTDEVRAVVQGLSGAPWEITWSADGQSLLYTYVIGGLASPTGSTVTEYYRVPSSGGPPERIAYDGYSIESMDRMRPNPAGAAGFILGLTKAEYGGSRVATWDGATVTSDGSPIVQTLVDGYHAHYSCDNSRFIYTAMSSRSRGPVAVFDVATKTSKVFSTDSNVMWTDWLPC